MLLSRRRVLSGFIAAPAVIAYDRLMPVRGIISPFEPSVEVGEYLRPSTVRLVVTMRRAGNALWVPVDCESTFTYRPQTSEMVSLSPAKETVIHNGDTLRVSSLNLDVTDV